MKIKHFAILAALGVSALVTPAMAQEKGTTPVIVSTVQERMISDEVEALGTLKANESVDLTSTVTELVTKVMFDDGQRVKKGDILVEMDAAEEVAELSEQKSFLAEAQRQVDRLEPLVKKGAASASVLDERRREALGAKARIEAIMSRIEKRVVRAPYDGVLGLRNISVGALAQPGTMITTIDDDSVMKLDFSVPEVFLSTLKTGVEIEAVTKAYPDQVFKGKIGSVDSRIDPVTRSIQARALIDNPDGKLKPGLLMQVELKKNPRATLVVPEEALIPEGSKIFVLVTQKTDEGVTAKRTEIQVGTRLKGVAEVISGLNEGDQVITHGTLRVRPGSILEITAVEDNDETLYELMGQKGEKEDKNGDESQ